MFLCGITLMTVLCCQKESSPKSNINDSDILGTWVNTSNSKDTIQISDTLIARKKLEANCYYYFYKYTIKIDSIILIYKGFDKVGFLPFHKKLSLNSNKDSLTIQSFHSVYPSYQGDTFKKSIK